MGCFTSLRTHAPQTNSVVAREKRVFKFVSLEMESITQSLFPNTVAKFDSRSREVSKCCMRRQEHLTELRSHRILKTVVFDGKALWRRIISFLVSWVKSLFPVAVKTVNIHTYVIIPNKMTSSEIHERAMIGVWFKITIVIRKGQAHEYVPTLELTNRPAVKASTDI